MSERFLSEPFFGPGPSVAMAVPQLTSHPEPAAGDKTGTRAANPLGSWELNLERVVGSTFQLLGVHGCGIPQRSISAVLQGSVPSSTTLSVGNWAGSG